MRGGCKFNTKGALGQQAQIVVRLADGIGCAATDGQAWRPVGFRNISSRAAGRAAQEVCAKRRELAAVPRWVGRSVGAIRC